MRRDRDRPPAPYADPVTSRPATGLPPRGPAAAGAPIPSGQPSADPQDGTTPSSTGPSLTPRPFTPPSTARPPTAPQPHPPLTAIQTTSSVAEPPASRPLAGDIPGERHRLSHRVIAYWRWRALGSAVPTLLLLIALAIVIPWGPWWMRWGIVGIAAVLVVMAMVILPPIRYRVFWYAISPTEIDIQHGIIFIKRSVVPVHRVQNLRTERGPIADHYRMTNLKIRTAAGSVNLSGLDRREADELCERISALADVADDV